MSDIGQARHRLPSPFKARAKWRERLRVTVKAMSKLEKRFHIDGICFSDAATQESVMPHYTAIVTLLAIALYFFLATRVAVAHAKFGVKLPATSGNPDFERVFRAHENTLEWMPTFLVPLWLCAIYLSDVAAAALG